nr:tetratricopeptide repeat protein [Methanobacterium formicicum]
MDYFFDKGTVLFYLGEYDKAIRSYEKFLKEEPTDVDALYFKGLSHHFIRENEVAQELINRALALIDKSDDLYPDLCNAKGEILFDLEDYPEAIDYFQKAAEADPTSFIAQYNIGRAFYEMGKLEDALKYIEQALKIEPNEWDVINYQGLILMDMGRREEAIQCFDRIIELHPIYFPAWYNKGVVLKELGRTEEALEHLDQAIKLILDKKPGMTRGMCLREFKKL